MKTAIVIPARMESSRFPGKPIVRIHGKPLIQHAIDAAKKSALADAVLLATDSQEIVDAADTSGISVCLKQGEFRNGTERTAAAIDEMGWTPENVVILQCDEPDVDSYTLDALIAYGRKHGMATLASDNPITGDPNQVKVGVFNDTAIYFSRQEITGQREAVSGEAVQHVGAYFYDAGILKAYPNYPPQFLECSENLEQLRPMECDGAKWKVLRVRRNLRSVNVPSDLEQFATKREVTPKPWGRSIDLGGGLFKIEVNAGGYSSLHHHETKWNQFVPCEGRFYVSQWPAGGLVADGTHPVDGMPLTIAPRRLHQFRSVGHPFTAYETYWTDDGSEPDPNDIERVPGTSMDSKPQEAKQC